MQSSSNWEDLREELGLFYRTTVFNKRHKATSTIKQPGRIVKRSELKIHIPKEFCTKKSPANEEESHSSTSTITEARRNVAVDTTGMSGNITSIGNIKPEELAMNATVKEEIDESAFKPRRSLSALPRRKNTARKSLGSRRSVSSRGSDEASIRITTYNESVLPEDVNTKTDDTSCKQVNPLPARLASVKSLQEELRYLTNNAKRYLKSLEKSNTLPPREKPVPAAFKPVKENNCNVGVHAMMRLRRVGLSDVQTTQQNSYSLSQVENIAQNFAQWRYILQLECG